jgi:hypothetical protein
MKTSAAGTRAVSGVRTRTTGPRRRAHRVGLLSLGVRVVVIFGSFAIIAAFMTGLLLSQRILRWRLDRWLDAVSAEHGVPREDLVKYTTAWR